MEWNNNKDDHLKRAPFVILCAERECCFLSSFEKSVSECKYLLCVECLVIMWNLPSGLCLRSVCRASLGSGVSRAPDSKASKRLQCLFPPGLLALCLHLTDCHESNFKS
ncbi:hypothetical protein AAFF_G00108050 [Aldrovandia affinis]|uniref:Uncharacterized protein n=1 Tax=Aldrovandia affinis TaxID=143900 RepID=A0AAD7RWN3_9TELE|nr:hypothetical protein AAFF_G00108050 [Aldrovandia affinis]